MSATLAATLVDVFDRSAEKALPAEEETALVSAVIAGDSDALVALVYAYAPALRRAVGRVTSHGERASEDVRMAAVEGLIQACHVFDPERGVRLGGLVPGYALKAVREAAAPSLFAIPERTLARFYGLLRQAEGSARAAADLAPSVGMSRGVFLTVLEAVQDAYGLGEEGEDGEPLPLLNEARSLWAAEEVEDATTGELAALALDAISGDALATDVVRLAYGFSDYDPVPDAEIGARLGFSRAKVQRTRSKALETMRSALAVA